MFSPAIVLLSLMLFGTAALVPLMFFATQGLISLKLVFFSALFAFWFIDIFLYGVGWKVTSDRIKKVRYFESKPGHFDNLERAMRKYGFYFLFWSKFIFGSGIPTQILAGAYRFPLSKTMLVNLGGALAWISTVFVLAESIRGLSNLREEIFTVQIGFLAFMLSAGIVYYLVSSKARKFFKLRENKPASDAEDAKKGNTGGNRNI